MFICVVCDMSGIEVVKIGGWACVLYMLFYFHKKKVFLDRVNK